MKNALVIGLALLTLGITACTRVPAGYVGVKVLLLGGEKGVDQITLGTGRYWVGMNEELHLFPTFQQNYTWTKEPDEKGDTTDESLTFQSKEGMSVNVDVGISYSIDSAHVSEIFKKYRKGVDELTDIVLRNAVRDALNDYGSSYTVEELYGEKKAELFEKVTQRIISTYKPQGILIENLYLVNAPRLPKNVVDALNAKIEATQTALRVQNEVAEARAQAEKAIAQARGEAEANKIKAASLTPVLMQYEALKKWKGDVPAVVGGGATPFINLNTLTPKQ